MMPSSPLPSHTPAESAPSPAALRDIDIVRLLQCGTSAAAFELIAARYGAKVYRLCFALLREPAAAQDAAQESLLRVWKALSSYDGRAALSTWIYAITRNRCLTALEGRRHDVSISDDAVQAEAEAVVATDDSAAREQAHTIRQLVEALPEVSRQAITLFYFEERSVAEVAAMLGQSPGTVKTHLFRARAALLDKLAALGLADPGLWAA